MARKRKKQKGSFFPLLTGISLMVILGGAFLAYKAYQLVYESNLSILQETRLEIPSGSNFDDVLQILESRELLKNETSFRLTAEKMNYPANVYAGSYLLQPGMSNRELLLKLRSGEQDPVKLTFTSLRDFAKLDTIVASYLEMDTGALTALLRDPVFLQRNGLNADTRMSRFIPNTYEFYWNTDAEAFCARMFEEFDRFWDADRMKRLDRIGLTRQECISLASIIEQEYKHAVELPTMAGVYLNRLKKGRRLESDPTVKFALGDWSIRRVLKKHLQVESPYNTYRNSGLPPGPICLPSVTAITSVLNAENHGYLYFCAKADLNGYHTFSESYAEHLRAAAAYRKALNQRNIY